MHPSARRRHLPSDELGKFRAKKVKCEKKSYDEHHFEVKMAAEKTEK